MLRGFIASRSYTQFVRTRQNHISVCAVPGKQVWYSHNGPDTYKHHFHFSNIIFTSTSQHFTLILDCAVSLLSPSREWQDDNQHADYNNLLYHSIVHIDYFQDLITHDEGAFNELHRLCSLWRAFLHRYSL